MRGFFHILRVPFVCGSIGALAMVYAVPAIAADASECAVKAAGENVVVIVCPPGLDQEAWRTAGERACILDNGICNAWIWDDAKKAPREAPKNDTDLSKEQVRHAVAIWDNYKQLLVVIHQVGQ